jgi:hypothetical protein
MKWAALVSLLYTIQPISALIGFELELSPLTVWNRDDMTSPIPERTVLYSSPRQLWNLTSDIFKQNGVMQNDFEIVTNAFPETRQGEAFLREVRLLLL